MVQFFPGVFVQLHRNTPQAEHANEMNEPQTTQLPRLFTEEGGSRTQMIEFQFLTPMTANAERAHARAWPVLLRIEINRSPKQVPGY